MCGPYGREAAPLVQGPGARVGVDHVQSDLPAVLLRRDGGYFLDEQAPDAPAAHVRIHGDAVHDELSGGRVAFEQGEERKSVQSSQVSVRAQYGASRSSGEGPPVVLGSVNRSGLARSRW